MKTAYFTIDSPHDTEHIAAVAEILRRGGLAAIPTETVYGLAANALDGAAVEKIFVAKGRPQDNPLIVHISDLPQLYPLVRDVPEIAIRLADAFWPGPLTMIFPKAAIIPDAVTCGLDTVAIRMPSHPIAAAIITACGFPLAAPSANTSGKPSPTRAAHVEHDMDGRIDAIVDGGACIVGVESTVLSLTGEIPRILRPGGVTKEMLEQVVGEVAVDAAVFAALQDGTRPASPGMKYQHYAPRADVIIVKGTLEHFCAYAKEQDDGRTAAICFDGEASAIPLPCRSFGRETHPEEQAQTLFDLLRAYDQTDVQTILVRCPSEKDIGMAVMNRLLRAAAFRVIEV